MNDLLDRAREIIDDADGNDWIIAILVGVAIQILVLLIMRVAGIFFRMATWVVASTAGVLAALWILDRQGVPRSLGGRRIDEWIDEARRAIGI